MGDIADLKKDAKSNPKMTPAEWSRLIMWMLLEDLLEEAFIATAYAFNTYLIVSSQGRKLLSDSGTAFYMPAPLNGSDTTTSSSSGGAKKRRRVGSGSNSLSETLLADLRKVDPAEEPERAVDILSRIKDITMSRAILKKTGIGRVVGRIARKAPPRVAAVAKPIVRRWKSIVGEERKEGDGDSAPTLRQLTAPIDVINLE